MFENCVKFKIPTHSKDWYKFRTVGVEDYPGGVGGSETGKILGLDEYRPVLAEVFHHKVGSEEITKFDNLPMCMGRILEPTVMHFWQCYNGETEEMVNTYEAWKKTKDDSLLIRKAEDVDCYLVNPKYPWLFTSLDFAIAKGQPNLITGEELETECPLEIKTISNMAAKKWEDGLPPKYAVQVNQQMIVTETNYAEIAVLVGSNDFKVYSFERDEELCDRIINETKRFWFERVLPARKHLKYRNAALSKNKMDIYEKFEGKIQHLEPEPDTTRAWQDYLSEKHKVEKEFVEGSNFDLRNAKKYKSVDSVIKALEKRKQMYKNYLLDTIVENKVEELDLLKHGRITYTGTKSKRLNVSIKSPDKKHVEFEVSKIKDYLYEE